MQETKQSALEYDHCHCRARIATANKEDVRFQVLTAASMKAAHRTSNGAGLKSERVRPEAPLVALAFQPLGIV